VSVRKVTWVRFFATTSKTALWLTYLHIQCISGALSSEIKLMKLKACFSSSQVAEIRNSWDVIIFHDTLAQKQRL
jgi:hypothetical protein